MVISFVIEVVSDKQKTNFKNNPSNEGRFIQEGLWSWSGHPNYFGEIVLWIGIAVIAYPVIEGWQYFALLSPIFVIFLLTKVSGINLLERQGMKRWGHEEEIFKLSQENKLFNPLSAQKIKGLDYFSSNL